MTPDRETLKRILKQARLLDREESKGDHLLRAYFKQVSPDQYPPFIEKGMVHGYLQAIEDIYGTDIRGHVSYWLYDVPSLSPAGRVLCIDQDGNKYDASNLGSYVNFILAI